MNNEEKEYKDKICSKCKNRKNDIDLCDIRRTMNGKYKCVNEDIDTAKEYIETLRKVSEEVYRINLELEAELISLLKKGERLSDYELWINEKCSICIKPNYIIKTVEKNFEKEKEVLSECYKDDLVYVIIKKGE